MATDGRLFVALTAALLMAEPLAASSRGIHYGAVNDPDVLACDRQRWRGDEAASRCYADLLRTSDSLAARAEAAWALNDLQAANTWFQQALRMAPDNVEARVRWGDLYAASHQDAEAMNIYREALEVDADNAYAQLGAASVLAGAFDDEANAFLEVLLSGDSVADGARIGALLLTAWVSLENGNAEQAAEALDEATELVEQNEWPLLEVYAIRAAADHLAGITDSRWTSAALEQNQGYGGIYAVPAHFYVITRRYREAIDLYQQAVDIEPGLAAAHENLGVNLLRDNQVSRARDHLVTAHDQDPFSPVAVNTLRLLDSFSNFDLLTDPPVGSQDPGQGLTPANVPIVLRLHKEESAAIAPYAIELTRDSIIEFTERYDFELAEPVIIEMYPDHEDFAVRTAGMPGLGILGATFGYVVAMDSPSGRPPEHFQWGTTLWHEMAHVFTLEATNHLVPRWFSEGVSVFEEWRSGPNPGVRIPMAVYNAMEDDRFLPVAELDEGFLRPTYQEQVIVSYMQAGLICQFLDRAYGAAALTAMLDHFRDGLDTRTAIENVTGGSAEDFDDAFADFVQEQHGAILDNFDEWHRTQVSIGGKTEEEDWSGIVDLADYLLELLPGYVEPDSPWLSLANAREQLGEREAAIAALERFWRNGGYDPGALRQLGEWLQEAGRNDDAIEVLRSVMLVNPLDGELHGLLGDLLLDAGRPADALTEFSVLLALDPHDRASAFFRLASAYRALGDTRNAEDKVLMALDVAPNFRPAQRLLLDLKRAQPDIDQ